MRNILIFTTLIFIACSGNDKQAKLKELEAQQAALAKEIENLRKEISASGENTQNNKQTFVTIETVKPGVFKHYIKVQGMVESDNNIFLPAKSSGIVKKIYVTEGEKVSKGQLLAELDGAILEYSIAELKTNLELATTVFERQQRLWDKKIGSEVQYLQAKTTKESLEKRLKSLNEQYLLTKFIAPISGTVDQVLIKEGEAAAPGFGAIRIVRISELKISAVLSEEYIGQVKSGHTVEIEIPVLRKKFSSTIQSVSQVIDPQNRTFSFEVKIPSTETDIKPNMLAVLTINNYNNPEALTVPVNIVQKSGEGDFLFTAEKLPENGENKWTIHKKNVETGLYYHDKVEIHKGLKNGDYVVVFGYQDLANGQIVTLSDPVQE